MRFGRIHVDGPAGPCGLAYVDWGRTDASRTVLCVHGLSRNGRDFDRLAAALTKDARVICPDVAGRGLSDPLRDPTHYATPTYVGQLLALIAKLGLVEVDWVGTSMGALIGMGIAAMEASPIRRLVVNDAGPLVPKAAIERIATYLGNDERFDSLVALEAHLREIHAPFGPLTDDEWAHLARHSAARRADGRFGLGYDQRIAEPFRQGSHEDIDLWALWDQIRCPVLALRGADSDLLLPETAREMGERGPRARVVEFEGVGHAPALMAADQIALVRDWLLAR